jgi:hypothetical protein
VTRLLHRWNRLAVKDRRAITLGTTILAPALLLKLVVLPGIGALTSLREEVARERDLLTREEQLLREADRWPVRYREGEARLIAAAPQLYDGADPVAGAGALAGYLSQRAVARRVFLQQTELRPTIEAGPGVTALSVELRGSTDLEGLVRFMHDIESGRPLVRVERVHVERTARPAFGSSTDEQVLSFSLTVRGFALTTDSAEVAR